MGLYVVNGSRQSIFADGLDRGVTALSIDCATKRLLSKKFGGFDAESGLFRKRKSHEDSGTKLGGFFNEN